MKLALFNKSKDTKFEKVKYPIGIKLVVIISILLVASLSAITILVSSFVGSDVQVTAEETNHTVNTRSANSAETELSTIRSNSFLLLDMLNVAGSSGVLARQASVFFFDRNQNIASISIPGTLELVNTRFFTSNELDASIIKEFITDKKSDIDRCSNGEIMALNAASYFDMPVIALLYPWKEGGTNQAVVIMFSTESLTDTFGTGSVNSSFMINHNNEVLIHPDFEIVKAAVNYDNSPLVQQMRKNNDDNRQILYKDVDGKKYFGSYNKLDIGDICVLTNIERSLVLETVRSTTVTNICLMFAILFVAILFIWFFSKSISTPVKNLALAANDIEEGKYDIQLSCKSQDEMGLLTESFVKMGKGLAERERLKTTFGKFINKAIAEKALKGELTLGGETKNATIFFSDIRSFTAISEKLEPFEVVGFLNDYMTRMVQCVNVTGGVVDKFIGDAVMAVWGAPVSSGTPEQDALNCVTAALMMRYALIEFNKGRGTDKKPLIKIGCGINTGPVVAGQIGSNERMEYTVIGDAVNFASRTESLNKPFGSDILITENTYQIIKDKVVVEEMPSVTVKGKEKPVKMFAVIDLKNQENNPTPADVHLTCLDDVRNLLNIPKPDLDKVDTNAEEKKYKIKGK